MYHKIKLRYQYKFNKSETKLIKTTQNPLIISPQGQSKQLNLKEFTIIIVSFIAKHKQSTLIYLLTIPSINVN